MRVAFLQLLHNKSQRTFYLQSVSCLVLLSLCSISFWLYSFSNNTVVQVIPIPCVWKPQQRDSWRTEGDHRVRVQRLVIWFHRPKKDLSLNEKQAFNWPLACRVLSKCAIFASFFNFGEYCTFGLESPRPFRPSSGFIISNTSLSR